MGRQSGCLSSTADIRSAKGCRLKRDDFGLLPQIEKPGGKRLAPIERRHVSWRQARTEAAAGLGYPVQARPRMPPARPPDIRSRKCKLRGCVTEVGSPKFAGDPSPK